MKTFSLILPTFNESENIQKMIPTLFEMFQTNNISAEVIVVDDDSPDLTWKIAGELSEKYPDLRVVRRFRDKGLSAAVLAGMEASVGRYIGVMDADFQHDERIIPAMLKALEEHEMVVGSRLAEDGGYGDWGFVRKTMSQFATLLAKIILPIRVKDPMSGFFALRREVYEEISPNVNPRGFKILLEFLGRKKNISVKEVGYVFRNRTLGETKMSGSVIQDYLIALLEIRFGNIFSWTFVKYCIIGVSGVFVNLIGQKIGNIFLHLEKHDYAKEGYSLPGMAVIFGFLLSLVNNFFWNNSWTFKESRRTKVWDILKSFGIFSLVSLLGLFIQLSVWRYSHSLYLYLSGGVDFPGLIYICNFLGILVATVGNYYLNKNITWKKEA